MVRTTSSLEPYQKAFVILKDSVNGSGIFQHAIDLEIEAHQNVDPEEIQSALEDLYHENGIDPNQAIKQSTSLDELINKANSHTTNE